MSFNIKDELDFFEKKEFMQTQGMFGNELFADVVISQYVYGNLNILGMTKQQIYNECIEIYCNEIKKGAITSKYNLAEQLLNEGNLYLTSDKVLAEFLIHIASYENSSGACVAVAEKFFELNRPELGYFWQEKSLISNLDKIGIKLNLTYDQINKKIILN